MSVMAIIVSYYPDAQYLNALVNCLSTQVEEILIVDNTPAEQDIAFSTLTTQCKKLDQLRMVRLGCNYGIAAALNVGIDVAINEGFSHILLSDQDSLPTENMVAGLLRAEQELLSEGHKVAGIGPLIRDLVTEMDYSFQTQVPGDIFYSHKFPTQERPNVCVTSLITSGMLVQTAAIEQIGNMREELFIDHVDVEWCHRAIAGGYEIFGTGYGTLQHRLGDGYIRVWYFGWRNISQYSSLRLYYRFRNFVFLLQQSYIPLRWKIRATWYWLGFLYSHVIFSSNRLKNLLAVARGVWDGIIGTMGPYRESLIPKYRDKS